MEMSGEQRIPASRAEVWRALNDPEILKACIPGCQELVKASDTEMAATVVLKVGPVSARFKGAVTLSDLDPPNSYRITGEGQGGVAGFAKGVAQVRLEDLGEGETLLRYEVAAEVGGKLAQLGARLIDATARQMSGAFFRRFAEEIVSSKAPAGGAADPIASPGASASTGSAGAAPGPLVRSHGVDAGRALGPAQIGAILFAAAIAGYLGGALHGMPAPPAAGFTVSADLVSAIVLTVVAALGYLFGRLASVAPR